MRNPEILTNNIEFKPELAPDRDVCLRSLIKQAQVRLNNDGDFTDHFLAESLNDSVLAVDEESSQYFLGCKEAGCGAVCGVTINGFGVETTLQVTNPVKPNTCAKSYIS